MEENNKEWIVIEREGWKGNKNKAFQEPSKLLMKPIILYTSFKFWYKAEPFFDTFSNLQCSMLPDA